MIFTIKAKNKQATTLHASQYLYTQHFMLFANQAAARQIRHATKLHYTHK